MSAYTRASMVATVLAAAFVTPIFAATPAAQQNFIQKSAHAGTLRDGKVIFSGDRITIPVVAVAPGAPDTTFEIHGRVDPLLVVPAGARLRFELVNNDAGMAHTLDVSTAAPPYAPVPADLPIAPPRKLRSVPGLFAVTGEVSARSRHHAHLSIGSTGWFRLAPGSYYYVCAMPGHAHRGMYGKLIARKTGG